MENSTGLMAAATATAAPASASGETAGRRGRAGTVAGRGEDGKLDRGLFAGTFGAGDFLLLVDDNFFEVFFAVFADVFVDGHWESSIVVSSNNYSNLRGKR
jgi:hypothetical protein